MSAIIKQANVYEDGSAQVMARVLGNDASAVTQSSISSGTYTVHDYYLNTEVTSSTSLTIASVIFDTLQTDARWSADSTGYNFRFTVPAASLPSANTVYLVHAVLVPSSGENIPVHWKLTTMEVIRS